MPNINRYLGYKDSLNLPVKVLKLGMHLTISNKVLTLSENVCIVNKRRDSIDHTSFCH